MLSKGTVSVALLWMVSAAVSSGKNSFPNQRRHHVAVDRMMVMFSGGRIVHRSAVSSSRSLADVALPSTEGGTVLSCYPGGWKLSRKPRVLFSVYNFSVGTVVLKL